tara:strand:- start:4544 stop:5266 length:723 start_codon:yes stop_codon:yes gene_type:complete
MEKSKKIKLFIALSYLIIISLLLYLFFSNFSFKEITSYEFIKNHRNYFLNLRDTNLFILSMLFLLVTILWVFPLLGFGSPIAMLGGFILGKWLGALIVILGLSIGATLLYIFGNYFLKDFVKEKFSNKYENLNLKFKKSEFTYLLIYRFCGGIPWQLSCLLPTIFNVKIKNFFYATLIGIVPQVFLVVSIGSGLEKVINENLNIPGPMELIGSPEIYVPLIVFFCLVIITIFLRKKFYSK